MTRHLPVKILSYLPADGHMEAQEIQRRFCRPSVLTDKHWVHAEKPDRFPKLDITNTDHRAFYYLSEAALLYWLPQFIDYVKYRAEIDDFTFEALLFVLSDAERASALKAEANADEIRLIKDYLRWYEYEHLTVHNRNTHDVQLQQANQIWSPEPIWWNKDNHQDRRPFLIARNKIKSELRRWFENQDFLEVETGALQTSPGNETHLHAFSTQFLNEDGTENQTLYLHTSPEFSCKKLLAAGETKIVDFARVYRNREAGKLHSPEFTMIEWYRKDAPLINMMNDCASLARHAAKVIEVEEFSWQGTTCDPFQQPEYLTLCQAFQHYVDLDLKSVLNDKEAFALAAAEAGVMTQKDASWSDIFSAVLVSKIEPELGKSRLTFLHRYPICEAALARPCPDDNRFAERFEMYACGIELANGFGELTDPTEQRKRFESDMLLKLELYGETYPIDEDFLAALHDMPDASGVALGFERLVMLASGARRISDVLWTPFPSQ